MPVIARSGSVEPFALRTETPKALLTLRSRGQRLVAETGADGDLVAALGATAAEHSGAGLGLHAGKKAVGLGPVTAIGLKGTLRHDKNSCGRRQLLLKFLAIAAISKYTRSNRIFPAKWSAA